MNEPKIRFPEFTGEWVEKKLGEIGDTYNGLSGKSKEDFEKGDSKFITFMNVLNNVIVNNDILAPVDVKEWERQNKVKKGDMLFNTSSETPEEVGYCSVYDSESYENVYLNSFCFGYRFKNTLEYNPLFLAYFFRSSYGRKLMHKLAQGVTRYNLSKENFNKILIHFPTLLEQQKIASCLSELDALICTQGKKVDALKEKKKGMMQQLFPQPGETTPRLRFPGFTGEWEEKKLDDVCKSITPPLKLQSKDYLLTGKYPIVDQSQSFICGWTNDDAGLITNTPVIIFGDHTCVLKYIDFPFVQGADGVKILSPKDEYVPSFVYQSFMSNPIKQDGYKRHFTDLKEKHFFFPVDKNEQQKIASCLSELDALIADEAKQLDALKEKKKGLMQQLFPQPNK